MARTDDDSWSITESVGVTAIGVAAMRAAETVRPDRIIVDEFAKPLVLAVGADFANRFSVEHGAADSAASPQAQAALEALVTYQALRTKFFDGFFVHAAEAGIRQAVILASGLDARAYRLPWPADTVVYEIDQPEVLEFKTQALAGSEPTATRVAVGSDLRQDWLTALIDEGFDPAAPTAWSAEGLQPYLPAEAQDLLFEQITDFSAPGSRFAIEVIDLSDEDLGSTWQEFFAGWFPSAVDQIDDLFYLGPRQDPKIWLAAHDWDVLSTDSAQLVADTGRLDKYGPDALARFRRAFPGGELLAAELPE